MSRTNGTRRPWPTYDFRKIEIVKENFETEVCNNIPEYPIPIAYPAASSWDDGKVTVCGGVNGGWGDANKCYSLENGEWTLSYLLTHRVWHAASNIKNSVWITGNRIQIPQKFQISIKI